MATSTRATYSAGTRRFLTFCRRQGVQPLPARKPTVVFFVAELSRSLAPATVAVYVAAVSSLHRLAGLRDPTRRNTRLQLAMRGLRRLRTAPASAPRRPVTAAVLTDLLTAIRHSRTLHRRDGLMLSAAFTLAFFGFLRISEFTAPSLRQFDPRIHPTMADIHWAKNHFTFHIRHSKTDQHYRGQTVHLPRLGGRLCPFTSMDRYVAGRGSVLAPSRTPLFTFTDGRPLTRSSCLKHLRRLLQKAHHPPAAFNTHSFRIGAATSAAHSGVPSTTIKRLGRWWSGAYRRYVRPQQHTLTRAIRRLAHPRTAHS